MSRTYLPAVFIGQPDPSSFHIPPVFTRLPGGLTGGGATTLMYPSDNASGGAGSGGYTTLMYPSDSGTGR